MTELDAARADQATTEVDTARSRPSEPAAPEPRSPTADAVDTTGEAATATNRARRERRGAGGTPPADLEPVVAAGPRTVGRFIADALRSAGVRYAFTVPGESFLGLLDAFEGAGHPRRRDAPRRRRGVHGRGARAADRAAGGLSRDPCGRCGATSPSASTRPARIRPRCSPSSARSNAPNRGREAFQEIDQVATLGGLAKWAAEPAHGRRDPRRDGRGDPPGPGRPAWPGAPVAGRGPARRADGRRCPARRGPAAGRARDRRGAPLGHRVPGLGPAPGHPGRSRHPAGPDVDRADPLRRAPPGPGHRRLATRRRHLERPPAVPRDGRLRRRPDRPRAAGRRRRAAGHRVAPQRADDVRLRDAARRPGRGRTSTSCRAARGSTAPTISVAPTPRRSSRRPTNGCSAGPCSTPRSSRPVRSTTARTERRGRPPRSSTRMPWDGPGVHPGRTIATLRRVLPDDAIVTTDAGNFASWAGRGYRFRRPGTFLGPTSGAMGYGLPAAIAAALVHRDRPVVALVGDGGLAMTMAELETAIRLGRPGRGRRLRQRALRHDPDVAGTAGDRRRRGDRARRRSTSRRSPGPAGRVAPGSSATPTSSRRCGRRWRPTARRSSRSRSTRPGCRSTSRRADATDLSTSCRSRSGRRRIRREPYAAASLATEGFIHCTDGVGPLAVTFDRYYAADPRPFLALTVDLDALDVPWRYDVPGSPYPHIYGSDRPLGHRRRRARRREPRTVASRDLEPA